MSLENSRIPAYFSNAFLAENSEQADEIEYKLREALGLIPTKEAKKPAAKKPAGKPA